MSESGEYEDSRVEQVMHTKGTETEILTCVSHDIRMPVNAIINMTRFAREDCLSGNIHKLMDDLDKLECSGNYLLELLNNILDISKIASGKMVLEPSVYSYDEFACYIDCMIKPLCAQNNVQFVWNKRTKARDVYIDKVRFNQLIFNLLSNAVKYTPAGGTVTLKESGGVETEDSVTCDFSVIDTGIGMTEEFQKNMFEPFTRDKNVNGIQGTGLGLLIAREITALLNGTLTVTSEIGRGSTFTVHITMPFAKKAPISIRNRKIANAEENLHNKCILIAEDHVLNMEIMKRLLEVKGTKVITSRNGQEVLESFCESEESSIDAILMDMQMPVKDGLCAAREIRALSRRDAAAIPIIAMTANTFEADRMKADDAGMTGYITKPIDAKQVYRILNQQINK